MRMEIIRLDSVPSTNTWLRERPMTPLPVVVVALRQTAGRGQRGNSWEAEPGKNLTFSFGIVPPENIAPAGQFIVSQAVSLAVTDTLREFLGVDAPISVKWPNDIYVGDCKIAGILIENTINASRILRSVIGIGLNVNQTVFVSDAPNPTSMALIVGKEFSLDNVLESLAEKLLQRVESVADEAVRNEIAITYRNSLWRGNGVHPFQLPDGTVFFAGIGQIHPAGEMELLHTDGSCTVHPFKSVQFII